MQLRKCKGTLKLQEYIKMSFTKYQLVLFIQNVSIIKNYTLVKLFKKLGKSEKMSHGDVIKEGLNRCIS